MFVYKITNQVNGKSYIGYDKSMRDRRWSDHKRDYLKEKFNKKLLYRAMNKYSVDNFLYERIDDNIKDLPTLKEREIYWIKEYKSFGELGYNMTKGGDGGCGNKTFLDSASEEELFAYIVRLSNSKKNFFSDQEKRDEWSARSIKLNTAKYIIDGRTAGRKKWWASLSDVEKSEYQRSRASRTYKLFHSDGREIITDNLQNTAVEIGITYNYILLCIKKNKLSKGWKFEIMETK